VLSARATKVIPHAFGERAMLKLLLAALIRAAERWLLARHWIRRPQTDRNRNDLMRSRWANSSSANAITALIQQWPAAWVPSTIKLFFAIRAADWPGSLASNGLVRMLLPLPLYEEEHASGCSKESTTKNCVREHAPVRLPQTDHRGG
jgi:hypothetical protein